MKTDTMSPDGIPTEKHGPKIERWGTPPSFMGTRVGSIQTNKEKLIREVKAKIIQNSTQDF